jgi:hypothetical protein
LGIYLFKVGVFIWHKVTNSWKSENFFGRKKIGPKE